MFGKRSQSLSEIRAQIALFALYTLHGTDVLQEETMHSLDPFLQEMEAKQYMKEAQHRARNERLANQARAGQPSLAQRARMTIERMVMSLSGRTRTSRRRTATSKTKLARGDVLIL
jgi:hypothetical protein